MKINKSALLACLLLILTAALYRVWEGRPFGFAPQLAMAIFGGAVISNKRLALFMPLLSLLFSDLIYQLLFIKGYTTIPGFYEGQVTNYVLLVGLTCFGFLMKKINALRVLAFGISGSLIFFLTSNFAVWAAGAGFARPKTFDGLMLCYGDALAFYRDYGFIHGFAFNFVLGDLFFCGLLFGAYALLRNTRVAGLQPLPTN